VDHLDHKSLQFEPIQTLTFCLFLELINGRLDSRG